MIFKLDLAPETLVTHIKAGWKRWRDEEVRRRAFKRLLARRDVRLLLDAGITREEAEALLDHQRLSKVAGCYGLGGRAN